MISPDKPNIGGRPSHQPSKKSRETVEQMRACGDSHATIARALGLDDDTLRKHYGEELLTGGAKKRREVIAMMFRGAKKGNASLARRLEELTRAGGALDGFGDEETGRAAPKLGKKEVARQAALDAGKDSAWGDDLAPPPTTLPN